MRCVAELGGCGHSGHAVARPAADLNAVDLLAQLHPPLGPSDWWYVAAVFSALAALVCLLWPLGRKVYAAGLRRSGVDSVPLQVRHTYLTSLNGIETAWRTGELSDRQVAHRLSGVIRDFAKDAWGLSIAHMTLRELKVYRLGVLAAVIEDLYAAEFAGEDPPAAGPLIDRTRGLISRWS